MTSSTATVPLSPVESSSHPVADLIRRRAAGSSQPGRRKDPHRLAVAVEGGGMRGVVSSSMLSTLERFGLRDVFDEVYGSSAGAFSGAYFVSGQSSYGTPIFYEELLSREFFSYRRIWGRKPLMSLEFLIDELLERGRPLDWKTVLSSQIQLHVIAASLSQLTAVDLSGFRDKAQLWEALRASARIPVIAGPPVLVDGTPYLDASLFESIPFRSALRNGCTHVLVLKSRPAGAVRGGPSRAERWLVRRRLRAIEPALYDAYLRRGHEYGETMGQLAGFHREPAAAPPYVLTIEPAAGTPAVGQIERNREILLAGAQSGRDAVVAALPWADADGSGVGVVS